MIKMSSKELRELVNRLYNCHIPENGMIEDEEEFKEICAILVDLTENEDDLFTVMTTSDGEFCLWEIENLETMYNMERDSEDGHYKGNFIGRMVINGRETATKYLDIYYDNAYLFTFYPPYVLD